MRGPRIRARRAAAALLLLAAGLCLPPLAALPARAEEAAVAVASNFLKPLRELAPGFEAATGHTLKISAGSTGKLYAQIAQGAPFDLFLAANAREPERLETEGEAAEGSRFTYALGRLVFWSAAEGRDPELMLVSGDYERLAIANPKLAPYGRAALQALERLGAAEAAASRTIAAETVSQALQFAESGNADLAAFAHSQILAGGFEGKGSLWIVPSEFYDPVRQQAVLLKRGEGNAAATAFLAYLRSEPARAAIRGFGYGVE